MQDEKVSKETQFGKLSTSDRKLFFDILLTRMRNECKHVRMILDTKLDFSLHLKYVQGKVNKTIGLLRKFQDTLPRLSLITIFKSFLRPQLHYGDIIYNQAYNSLIHQNIELIQYNVALVITGAVRGTCSEKL